MAVYGYTRVSSVQQVENTSLSEQRRRIQAIADFHGWPIDDFFEDKGVSGGDSLHTRPMGQALLAKLKPGDTLIVAKLDRLFRSAEDAIVRTNKWAKTGIGLILGDVSTDPVTGEGVGRLFFTLLAAMAEFERHRINERAASGREAKKRVNGYLGGKTPFGYTVEGEGKYAKLVPDPATFPVRSAIVAMRLRGNSFGEIHKAVRERYPVEVSLSTIKRVGREAVPNLLPRSNDQDLPEPLT